MPRFSKTSRDRLSTCHPLLQELFNSVISTVDCSILEGHRPKEKQDAYFATGRSKTPWPTSKHNAEPSLAVDAGPWFPGGRGVLWPDRSTQSPERYARILGQWYMFVGYVRGKAEEMGIAIRCGADWDGDWDVEDQRFHDLPHFELLSTGRA